MPVTQASEVNEAWRAQPPASRLLQALEGVTRDHPTDRKRLIGPDLNFGRELLLALAQRTGGWIGWEAENLRGIARELAFVPLAEQGVRVAKDLEINLLVNRALSRLVEERRVGASFVELARSLGFRRALRDAVLELRTAGVRADELRGATRAGSPARDLASVLETYEALLRESCLADPAAVFRTALDAFDREADFVLDGVLALVPTLVVRGLPGELIERLLTWGALVLPVDRPTGIEPPPDFVASRAGSGDTPSSILAWASGDAFPEAATSPLALRRGDVDLFAAATPTNEIREVCRRVLAEGLRWDEVEIVATDPDTYGVALDALGQRLDLGATMLAGVPLARTRIGRALDRWFAWLADGLPADTLRQALEAGELTVDGAELPPTALARELRAHRIGWGRARYEAALARIESGARLAQVTRYEDEDEATFAARQQTRAQAARAVGLLLARLLAVVPAVPERGSDRVVRTSCARLAQATLAFLDMVPTHGAAEGQTVARLRGTLTVLTALHDEEVGFVSALAMLREALAEARAWPLQTHDRKPWSAAGGMLHLTDVAHGGTTGRRRVFVVGLDAARTAGAGRQDPLLPDAVRQAAAPGRLATVAERRQEGAFALGVTLASLRGRVTLSYAVSSALDGREEGPSPLLLQAWRLVSADGAATYESLRHALLPPASPVPAEGHGSSGCLDARDVWLRAMVDGPLLLDASVPLGAGFPGLARGLEAMDVANGSAVTPFHGHVPEAGAALDLFSAGSRAISPSALETIAKCPLSWFYGHGLRLRAPSDPDFDVTRWLDDGQRGTLLHEVYETFASEYVTRQDELATDAARDRMRAVTQAVITRWRDDVPPPGEAVFDRERGELERSTLAFLQLERARRAGGDPGHWTHFEYAFGMEGRHGTYALGNGVALPIRGVADRIDELPDGSLRVVDYKTGRPSRFGRQPKAGAFNGGRLLQPALYAAAIGGAEGKVVSEFEYRFPTPRGENEVITYAASELEAARPIVESLVTHVRSGLFLPTMHSSDCKYCDFMPICRAEEGGYHAIHSPRALWAEEHAGGLDEYASMRQRRAPTSADSAE